MDYSSSINYLSRINTSVLSAGITQKKPKISAGAEIAQGIITVGNDGGDSYIIDVTPD
ncbi:hypothetical protein [Microcoleus sp. CAWBG640]|uniref:hypothetical protein n=1 Tax=Microcoleus sp. CAWBG640 TaxID=2841653 RepID=UPI00312B5F96